MVLAMLHHCIIESLTVVIYILLPIETLIVQIVFMLFMLFHERKKYIIMK